MILRFGNIYLYPGTRLIKNYRPQYANPINGIGRIKRKIKKNFKKKGDEKEQTKEQKKTDKED